MIGNKIAYKITSVSKKKSTTVLHSKELPNDETEEDVELDTPKESYISPEEGQEIIDELKLTPPISKTTNY